MRTRPLELALLSLLMAVASPACGNDTIEAGGGSGAGPVEAEVEVAEIRHGVGYYGACGNEILTDGDLTLYPLLPEEREALDTGRYPADLDELGLAPLRVAEPGPGDDVGTLITYVDGTAHFASDSGQFLIWLTDEVRTYPWEC